VRRCVREDSLRDWSGIFLTAAAAAVLALTDIQFPTARQVIICATVRGQPNQLIGRSSIDLQNLLQADDQDEGKKRGVDDYSESEPSIEDLLSAAVTIVSGEDISKIGSRVAREVGGCAADLLGQPNGERWRLYLGYEEGLVARETVAMNSRPGSHHQAKPQRLRID